MVLEEVYMRYVLYFKNYLNRYLVLFRMIYECMTYFFMKYYIVIIIVIIVYMYNKVNITI